MVEVEMTPLGWTIIICGIVFLVIAVLVAR